MHDLAHQRCFNHAWREAAARCLGCGRYYCRECITEHEDRMMCASCLTRLTAARAQRKARLAAIIRVAMCGVGLLTVWFFFYLMGKGLLALPSSFHEGTVWQERSYWESE